MDESTRRKVEMGKRALEFCRAHPDSNPQWNAAVARLEAKLARAEELQRQEENELKLRRARRRPGPNAKVLPFGRRPNDPTDPAA